MKNNILLALSLGFLMVFAFSLVASAADRDVRYYRVNTHFGRLYQAAVHVDNGRINARPILHSMVKPHAHLAARLSMHNFDHGMKDDRFHGYVFPLHGSGSAHLPSDDDVVFEDPADETWISNWSIY